MRLAVFLLAAALFAGHALAVASEMRDGGRFGQVRFYNLAAGQRVLGLTMIVSDRGGWDAASDTLAQHLVDTGQAVIGIDLRSFVDALKRDRDCSSVNGDFEVLSRQIEKDLPVRQFHPPTIVGLGAGAAVAYAAVAEVLPNTFAGGIGLDFASAENVGVKFCLPDDPSSETPWVFAPSASFAGSDALRKFLAAMPESRAIDPLPDRNAVVDEGFRLIPALTASKLATKGLPIAEVPPRDGAAGARPLVVFYSGDGGWRDIDKQIGGYMAAQGFFVIGFDSLRYLWREKDPATMAADLDSVVRLYADQKKGQGVVLVGYSFGADILPFIYNRMAPDTKNQVKLISLLGIATHASFEIRIEGILGANNTDGPATLPELLKIRGAPVQCIYGTDEDETVCKAKELDRVVDRVDIAGDHHFDGDYRRVADTIMEAAELRSGK